jgi:membrane protein YdbS with pleckstrin-like domain
MTEKPTNEAGRSKSADERLLEQVYDHYRDTLLNRKYYASRLTRVRRQSRAIEIALALAAPGAVVGWAIWHTAAGERVWSVVAAAIIVITVVKPLMN